MRGEEFGQISRVRNYSWTDLARSLWELGNRGYNFGPWPLQRMFAHRMHFACVHAKSPQSCLALCGHMATEDHSPLGFSVHRILQARMLEWVVMPSSRGSSSLRDQKCLTSPALTGGIFTISAIWEAQTTLYSFLNIAKIIFEIFVFIDVSRDLRKMPTVWPSFKCRYLVLSSSDSRLDPTTLEVAIEWMA